MGETRQMEKQETEVEYELVYPLPDYMALKPKIKLIKTSKNVVMPPYYGEAIGYTKVVSDETTGESKIVYKSFFKVDVDNDVPEEKTLFYKALHDESIHLLDREQSVVNRETDKLELRQYYYVQYRNPLDRAFLPTVTTPVIRASNTRNRYVVELVFQTEEMHTLWVYREIKTSGSGAFGFVDFLSELDDILDDMDLFIEELYPSIPGASIYEDDDKAVMIPFFDIEGDWIKLEFYKDEFYELRDMLVSVRIIENETTIL